MSHPVSSRTGTAGRRTSPLFAASVAGAALLAIAGCGSAPTTAYDLSAPGGSGRGGGASQIVIADPTALQANESERIAVRDAAGSMSLLPGGQWADRLPRLVQARLIQTFENTGRTRASRPGDGVTPDGQLNVDIRFFGLDAGRGEVVVELFARLLDSRSGRVTRSRLFSARAPVGSANPAEVAQSLDRVASGVFLDVARWVGSGPAPIVPPSASLRTGAL